MKNLFYNNCILCDAFTVRELCDACFKNLPRLPINHCSICSKTVSTIHDNKCGSCLSKQPAFTATIAALSYAFPVDALIHALKYQSQLAIAPILANLLIDRLESLENYVPPDLIIPMPLHPRRLQERGFNQALEIGRHVTQKMNITLSPDSCTRIKNTSPQTGLPWKARKKNVQKAFSCETDLSGKHVVVIDDVMTTGATLNELAHQLRKQGAQIITNWVIARAQNDKFYSQSDIFF